MLWHIPPYPAPGRQAEAASPRSKEGYIGNATFSPKRRVQTSRVRGAEGQRGRKKQREADSGRDQGRGREGQAGSRQASGANNKTKQNPTEQNPAAIGMLNGICLQARDGRNKVECCNSVDPVHVWRSHVHPSCGPRLCQAGVSRDML